MIELIFILLLSGACLFVGYLYGSYREKMNAQRMAHYLAAEILAKTESHSVRVYPNVVNLMEYRRSRKHLH